MRSAGFSAEQLEPYLLAAKKKGLGIKVHADQTGSCGGAQLAARVGAVSAEHLDHLSDDDLLALKKAGTVAVLLPGVCFHLMDFGRGFDLSRFKRTGVEVAIATNFNPGSSPCFSMQTMLEMAVRFFRMTPEEALHAATRAAAKALGEESAIGSITVGKKADFVIFRAGTLSELVDEFGSNKVTCVYKQGLEVYKRERPR